MNGPGAAARAEVVLARARAAGRGGDLAAAERLLVDADTPAELDVLARVLAQQGRLTEADACWARVQETDPDHPGAAAGRARIAAGSRRARRFAALALLVMVGAGVTGAVVDGADGPAAPSTDRAAPAPSVPPVLPVLPPRPDPPAGPSRADRLAALVEGLPDARVTRRGDTVEIVFPGLFTRGDRLGPEAAARLAELGGRLADSDASITVTGYAVAVAGGPQGGGSVVALARALVVAREIAASGDVPLTRVRLESADQSDNPWPEAAANRTAAVVIS
ncbi:hypothetical protein WEH80_02635 [Actinomycetes bacterium KLBMP 9759]